MTTSRSNKGFLDPIVEIDSLLEIISESRTLLPITQGTVVISDVDRRTKRLTDVLASKAYSLSASIIQAYSTIDDMQTTYRMLSRYPWHGTKVSKVQHFELNWFLFENLCYKFQEKIKLCFNSQKALVVFLGGDKEPSWLKPELKLVRKEFGEEIRRRGNTVHSWNQSQGNIDTFGMISILNQSRTEGEDVDLPDGFFDLKGHYEDTKWMLKDRAGKIIEVSRNVLGRILDDHEPLPKLCLKEAVDIIDSVNSGAATLS